MRIMIQGRLDRSACRASREDEWKRAFDAIVDDETGAVMLDVKDRRGNIIIPLSSLLDQIDQARKSMQFASQYSSARNCGARPL